MATVPVAALYVDPKGPYSALGADCWDVARDARLYDGPFPVIAHPPCGPYCTLRRFCTRQDPALALLAVEQVRRWGGILEHPRASLLWRTCHLPVPWDSPPLFAPREWALAVEQVRWGHPARKATWLLIVGISPSDLPAIPVRREPTSAVRRHRNGTGLSEIPASRCHLTPPAFAAWLLAAAAHAAPAD